MRSAGCAHAALADALIVTDFLRAAPVRAHARANLRHCRSAWLGLNAAGSEAMPQFDPRLISLMKHVLEGVMSKVPMEHGRGPFPIRTIRCLNASASAPIECSGLDPFRGSGCAAKSICSRLARPAKTVRFPAPLIAAVHCHSPSLGTTRGHSWPAQAMPQWRWQRLTRSF